MTDRQIAGFARKYRPGLTILFATGYAEHAVCNAPFVEAGMPMVAKPFALDALALEIREMLVK